MAITTYDELLTALASWSARSDMTAVLPDFVVLSETLFNYGDGKPDDANHIPPLRTRDMETTATVTMTSGSGSLPSDFLEEINVYTSTRTLRYLTPDTYTEYYPSGQSTDPSFYTIIGSTIYSGVDVTVVYYEKISALALSPNWLLTKAPNVYLHGGLYFLYQYNMAGDKALAQRALMVLAMAGLSQSDLFSRASAPQMRASMVAW